MVRKNAAALSLCSLRIPHQNVSCFLCFSYAFSCIFYVSCLAGQMPYGYSY